MQFPGPVRAVVGLLANAAAEARHLPDRAVELPMLAVSTALQVSLRAQQRYARLAARGDEVLHRRPPVDEPPPWATFDEPVSMDEARRASLTVGQAQATSDLLEELLGVAATDRPTTADDGKRAPSNNGPAKKKAPAKKTAAKRSAAKKTPAGPAPAEAAPANAEPAADEAAPRGKSVSKPRHTAPSPFDAVDDE